MNGPGHRTRIAIGLIVAALLLFSAAGKWLVFRGFLEDEGSGRQRIESPGASSADQSGS